MAYLGNDLQVAFPSYRNIDDISGGFDGVTTSFALTVDGVAPVPAPINSQQCLISVNGVVQRPDDSGTEGFRLSGGNIIFASAPAGGVDFFGVILAGADYVNVGANFPSGTAVVPSITFDSDLDTGIYNPAGNEIGFTTSGTQRLVINSSGQISSGLGTAAAPAFSFISDPNTGIYSPGADQVAISTSGTGRLLIDSSGRLLVGTSSSLSLGRLLQVADTSPASGAEFLRFSTDFATDSASLVFSRSRSGTLGTNTIVQSGDTLGRIQFRGANGTSYDAAAWIYAEVDGTPGASDDMPGRLVFSTTADGASSPTERMRIQNNGNINIGFTTQAAGSHNGVKLGPNDQREFSRTSTFTVNQIRFYNGNGNVGNIATSGSGTAYNTSSDYRLKENIVPIANGISRLQQLKPNRFNFIADPNVVVDGFIAHEVQAIVPEAITGEKDAIDVDGNPVYQGIDQSKLVPLLTAALQEAVGEIESLKARVAALESV